jgi:hypothetical protein
MSETIAEIEQLELLIHQNLRRHETMHEHMVGVLERALRAVSDGIEP